MKKILIAEDDTFIANALRIKLTKSGYEVKMTVDGEEALSALKLFTPDLIILDLILPKKDGFQVLEELKKNDRFRHIPVMIASNLGQKEDIDRGLKLGAADYIVKSDLSISMFLDKIKALTDM